VKGPAFKDFWIVFTRVEGLVLKSLLTEEVFVAFFGNFLFSMDHEVILFVKFIRFLFEASFYYFQLKSLGNKSCFWRFSLLCVRNLWDFKLSLLFERTNWVFREGHFFRNKVNETWLLHFHQKGIIRFCVIRVHKFADFRAKVVYELVFAPKHWLEHGFVGIVEQKYKVCPK
jgi:hypothetical protein